MGLHNVKLETNSDIEFSSDILLKNRRENTISKEKFILQEMPIKKIVLL